MKSAVVVRGALRLAWAVSLGLGGFVGLTGTVVWAETAPSAPAATAAPSPGWQLRPCRLSGYPHEAQCGVLRRPLDARQPQGRQIDVHVAVLPAVSRQRKPDPVFLLAGGPGQSAIALAGPVSQLLGRFLNRRDVVLVDQRGTGRSAPLDCGDDEPTRSLALSADPARQVAELQRCRQRLMALPHGDLRHYTTPEAMADLDAVRQAMGLGRINLIGVSYGTRAALDYLRQFPQQVRRLVLDGVAPPDMVLPLAFATDGQAALDTALQACASEPACQQRYPHLRDDWQRLLKHLPSTVTVPHPLTGVPQTLTVTREMLAGLVRGPLYAPVTASALPLAISEAAQGRWQALFGLNAGGAGGRGTGLASGMHFSVVCAEDMPRWARMAGADGPVGELGVGTLALYQQVCKDWPRGEVPEAYYRVGPASAPTLLLSGGLDPVTPPRHAQRVAQALGPQAWSAVVPQAGHGVMAAVPCWRDAVFRFVDAESGDAALQGLRQASDCAAGLPRPPALLPWVESAGARAGEGAGHD